MGVEVKSKTFRSGNSVALRLPKEVGFPADIDVTIKCVGDTLTVVPAGRPSLAAMIERLREMPAPGQVQRRDVPLPPKRRGL